jgi:hypothetical protein
MVAKRPEPKPWSQPGSTNCSSLAVRPACPAYAAVSNAERTAGLLA